jgi:HTH-type transcriptional regulator, competence development regulator
MTHQLGKVLKTLRVEHEERLLDMAEKIGVSVAFLSAIETGRKQPPLDIGNKIIRAYKLNLAKATGLNLAIDMARKAFNIKPATPTAHETVALLARSVNRLSEDKHRQIQEILRKGVVDDE